MKKKLLDRRGAAIELAIMMMVFSIFITTIVLTTALLQNSHKAKAELGIKQDIFLEQLGEEFVDAVVSGNISAWQPQHNNTTIPTVPENEKGHTWKEVTIAPTCTEDGRVMQVCEDCGEQVVLQTVSKLGHNTEGIDCRNTSAECKNGCGEVVDVAHDWVRKNEKGEWIPAVSCTGEVDVLCKCTVCGAEKTRDIPKQDHQYNSVITTAPKCEEKGEKTYICAVCGYSYEEDINALGHMWNDDEASVGKNCTEQSTMLCSCMNGCGATENHPVPHNDWDNGFVTKEPSHTEEGVMTYTCNCGATKTESIEKTKEHSFDINDMCICGARRNHYILTVLKAGKNAYKMHIQEINAEQNNGIPEGSLDAVGACGTVVLRVALTWDGTKQVYTITEWSKK